jgi:undecaprenyl diphosphate synthase
MSIDKSRLPRHIAIIMDGNGRWAKERGLPRTEGHRHGIRAIKEITKAANELGIKVLTFFAFSTENWRRPKQEINMLMRSLDRFLRINTRGLIKDNIRLNVIGDIKALPRHLQLRLNKTIVSTKDNSGMIINLALSYGSRQEIINAAKGLISDILNKKISEQDINEKLFSEYLYTKGLPDPDLLIRTSGEMRISNFLLWQISYSELYFCKKFWPDFNKDDLILAIQEYGRRERRFGAIEVGASLRS